MSDYKKDIIAHCSKPPRAPGGVKLKLLRALAESYGIENADDMSRDEICKLFAHKDYLSGECKEIKSLKDDKTREAPAYNASDCPGIMKKGKDGHFWRSSLTSSGFVWKRVSKAEAEKAKDKKAKDKVGKYAGHIIRPDRPIFSTDKILLGWEGLRRPTEIPIPEVRKDLKTMENHCKFLKELTKADLASPMTRRRIAVVANDTREVVYKYNLDKKEVGLIPEFSPAAFKHNCETIHTKLKSLIERKAYYE